MASSSRRRTDSANDRIKRSATMVSEENQSLIAEIRKFVPVMRGIAVELERCNQTDKVKQLEQGVIELLVSTEDCSHFSMAVQSVANSYEEPGEETTNFKKLLEDEVVKIKAGSSSNPQNHPIFRQFKEAIWNVHHAGQPMPGEEQEDVVMTSTQTNILNVKCPLSGKPVTELVEPVRCMDCKHVYEKDAVMHYMKSTGERSRCAVAGCPKILQPERVVCDPLLRIEIDEMRSMSKETAQPAVVEDFTELD